MVAGGSRNAEDFAVLADHDCRTKIILRTSPRMKTWKKYFWLVAGGCFAVARGTVFGQEYANGGFFPKDQPTMEIEFPAGFKAAFRKDGAYLAVGPKTVMALVSWEKVKD